MPRSYHPKHLVRRILLGLLAGAIMFAPIVAWALVQP
jgi:hypothetical protein